MRWRIHAWSEISVVAALVAFTVLTITGVLDPADSPEGSYPMLAAAVITTIARIPVTMPTRPTSEQALIALARIARNLKRSDESREGKSSSVESPVLPV